MIVLPSGARVWLACGYTDMRKGMDGLAMLAQKVLEEDPLAALCLPSGANGVDWSRSFGSMGKACAYSASDWRKATFSGRQPTLDVYR